MDFIYDSSESSLLSSESLELDDDFVVSVLSSPDESSLSSSESSLLVSESLPLSDSLSPYSNSGLPRNDSRILSPIDFLYVNIDIINL